MASDLKCGNIVATTEMTISNSPATAYLFKPTRSRGDETTNSNSNTEITITILAKAISFKKVDLTMELNPYKYAASSANMRIFSEKFPSQATLGPEKIKPTFSNVFSWLDCRFSSTRTKAEK
jgi:hypothetical protein